MKNNFIWVKEFDIFRKGVVFDFWIKCEKVVKKLMLILCVDYIVVNKLDDNKILLWKKVYYYWWWRLS